MTATVLSVGKKYPLKIPAPEGAFAELLHSSGNILIIAMADITEYEEKVLRLGSIRFGFVTKGSAIMLLWQFYDDKGLLAFSFDSPFDALLVDDIALHSIDNSEQRLTIEIHIVDSATKKIRGLRSITLAPESTVEFLSAVQDQIALGATKLTDICALRSLEVSHMCDIAVMREMGA